MNFYCLVLTGITKKNQSFARPEVRSGIISVSLSAVHAEEISRIICHLQVKYKANLLEILNNLLTLEWLYADTNEPALRMAASIS